MEIIADVALFNSPENIEKFQIRVNVLKKDLIVKRLKYERLKIINYLKELKEDEIIKSISRPKNKKIQLTLNEVVKTKKLIDKSIKKINTIFQ